MAEDRITSWGQVGILAYVKKTSDAIGFLPWGLAARYSGIDGRRIGVVMDDQRPAIAGGAIT